MSSTDGTRVSIVMPTYESKGRVVRSVRAVLEASAAFSLFEVIVVDDGSTDQTRVAMEALCMKEPLVRYLRLSRNFGQASAILCGIARASGDVIVVMDDDLEHDPASIPRLLDTLSEGNDYVFGVSQRPQKSWGRRFALQMRRLLMAGHGAQRHSSFIALTPFVRDEVVRYTGPFPYIASLLERASSRGLSIDVPVGPGFGEDGGASRYGFQRLARLWLNSFSAYSIRPLRLVSVVGAATAVMGATALVTVLIKKVIGGEAYVAGWPSLLAAVVFFSGLNILVLSVVGEYVGRTFMHISSAPQYVVRESMNCERHS